MITDSNATYVLSTEDKERALYVRKVLNDNFIRLWVCVFNCGNEYKIGCYDNGGGKLTTELVKEVKDVADEAGREYFRSTSR